MENDDPDGRARLSYRGQIRTGFIPVIFIGDTLLWIAGGLTVITGWDYWRASEKHLQE